MRHINAEQFRNYRKGRWQTLFFQNWWVAFFVLASYLVFANSAGKKGRLIAQLEEQVSHLKKEIALECEARGDLIDQIESRSDPRWIEMVLMQKLGLVPEGQIKVFFQKR